MKRSVIEEPAPNPGQPAAIMGACNSREGWLIPKVRKFMKRKPHHLGVSLEAHLTLGAGSPFLPADSTPHTE